MMKNVLLAALGVGGYLAYRAFKPRYDFRDQHVLITGGSRGLGLVLARQLASAGARLSFCSRDEEEIARARQDLSQHGANAFGKVCDVIHRENIHAFVASARHEHGPIDVLIHNAGVIRVGPMEEMSEEDYELSLRTHFWAARDFAEAVIPEMKARGNGRIVNIASFGGKVAVPHLLPYSTGKFALVGYSNGLRAELKRHGIVVTTVCPGLMRTGSHLNAEFKGRHEEEYAWFATGGAIPFFSMNAERAAAKILDACACGDAEAIIGWPAQLGVAAQTLLSLGASKPATDGRFKTSQG